MTDQLYKQFMCVCVSGGRGLRYLFFISFHSLNLFNLYIFDPLYQKGSDENKNMCVYLYVLCLFNNSARTINMLDLLTSTSKWLSTVVRQPKP